MMDFARRLAPARGGEHGRALPVLPSRMLGRTPIRSTVLELERVDENDDEEDVDLVLPPSAASASTTPKSATARTGATPEQDPSRDASGSDVAARSVAADPSVPAHRAADPSMGVDAAAVLPLAGEPRRARASHSNPEPRTALDRDGAHVHDDVRRRGVDRGSRMRGAATAAPALQAVRTPPRRVEPLSAPVLSERIAAPAAAVVHVHIDRIDLRLPGGAPTSGAAPRKAAPRTGAVSLADYLQARATAGARGAAR